jgi:sugar-specific transcriptional regulator TrmB
LGLNKSQAKIYLTLVSLGASDVKKIAQIARIDRGEAYRQLDILQRKGLVAKTLSFPNEYTPIDLSNGIQALIEHRNIESAEIQQKAAALLKKGIPVTSKPKEEAKLTVIPKDEYGAQHIMRVFKSIREELVWYSPFDRIVVNAAAPAFSETVKDAIDRGVRWRVVAELNAPIEEERRFIQNFQKKNPHFDIRFVNQNLNVVFTIWDHGKGMNFFTEIATGSAIGSPMLTTTNAQLIKVIKAYFEIIWDSAMTEIPKRKNLQG